MQIAFLNASSRMISSDASMIAQAITIQLKDFCTAWNLGPITAAFFTSPSLVPHGSPRITIKDVPDVADALGYHSEDADVSDGYVFVDPVLQNGGVVLFDPKNPQNVSVASVASHEALELAGDPRVNLWADGPELLQGSSYAVELCDPVENDSFVVLVPAKTGPVHVSVSNYVLPSWFDPQAKSPTKFDPLGRLHAPFTMSKGGYMVVRNGPGSEQQVFGETYPDWRKETKKFATSRTSRRSSYASLL